MDLVSFILGSLVFIIGCLSFLGAYAVWFNKF